MKVSAHFTGGPLDGETQEVDWNSFRFSGRYQYEMIGAAVCLTPMQVDTSFKAVLAHGAMALAGRLPQGMFEYHNYDLVEPLRRYREGETVEFAYAGMKESEGYDGELLWGSGEADE